MAIDGTKKRIVAHLGEFFVVGVLMGVGEDLLAIHFATEAQINWHIFKVAVLVAIPFAVISEIVVDLEIFHQYFSKRRKREKFGS